MDQLDLLCKLQFHDQKLDSIRADLNQLEKGGEINDIILEIRRLENSIKEKKTILKQNNDKIKKTSNTLDKLNYELTEIENNLYSGTVSDLKQLDYMDKESRRLKEETNNIELEILSLMEDIEHLKKVVEEIEYNYEKTKNKFKLYKIELENKFNKLKEEEVIEVEQINNIMIKLGKNIIELYSKIKKNKGYALAEVFNDECSGCHMIIPTYLLNKVKNEQVLLQCENCGRILYYNKMVEDKNAN